ncbi:MAG TPA: hypothetical protein P5248_00035 [Bacteroidales bacterium]|nr:hypothetical protein [Bacteroidales bacterium]
MLRVEVHKQLNDSSRAAIDMLAAKAVRSPELRRILLQVALEEVPQVSSRASRVIESCVQMSPATLSELETEMVRALPCITDAAVRRSLLKIFTTHPLPGDEDSQGLLMDSCFRYLTSAEEPIAVKVYCMDILYLFTAHYPEIAKELMLTLEEMVRRDSSAICFRGNFILKQLRLGNLPANPTAPGHPQ